MGACPCGCGDVWPSWRTALKSANGSQATEAEVGAHVGEALPAPNVLALVWFLARVGANVYREGAALDEALAASRRGAGIGALIGVDSVVSLQVGLAVEALLTLVSDSGFLPTASIRTSDSGMTRHGPRRRRGDEERTLMQDSQSHWKGRVVGSPSTSSMSSIVEVGYIRYPWEELGNRLLGGSP